VALDPQLLDILACPDDKGPLLVVLEAVVTYIRHDGKEVTVPAVTIFHLIPINASSTPLADECRIYVDLAPLFAA